MIIWNSLKLFQHIHSYLFIFANTEIKGFTVLQISEKNQKESERIK